jgi:hypothetical protein
MLHVGCGWYSFWGRFTLMFWRGFWMNEEWVGGEVEKEIVVYVD